MTITGEMQRAIELIETTSQPIYITGKAGTGKTTLLKYITQTINKKFVITASTGVAAVNAGGVTLHSLMGVPFGVIDPNELPKASMKKERQDLIRAIDTLIIDEISMITPDILDYIDYKLRKFRGSKLPFGGVQVVMFGDLFQLAPVVPKKERDLLLEFYDGIYFFYARVFMDAGFHIIELTHVFRQADERFVNILNHIREYQLTAEDMTELSAIRNKQASEDMSNDYIHICSLKRDVQKINQEKLGEATHIYEASIDGEFNKNAAPCDSTLQLRIGAKVMILVNDSEQHYCNGTTGEVCALDTNRVDVRLQDGEVVSFGPNTWECYDYFIEDGKIKKEKKGACSQIPLILAWAITVHKSQGLTFGKVALHTRAIFSPGQIYVALSRCTSLEGIVSDTFISQRHIIPDKQLMAFERAIKQNGYFFDNNTLKLMK